MLHQIVVKYNRWQRRICTLSVHSYVTSVNSFICRTKLLIIVIIKCLYYYYYYYEISAILCSLFSVFTLSYPILENMSTKVRKFRFI